MHRTRLSPQLVQLTRFGFINCFLVHEADGATLVDTGLAGSAAGILKAAEAENLTIRRILLTHAHRDHIGSLDVLSGHLPEAEIAIGAREERLLHRDFSLDDGEPKGKLGFGFGNIKAKPKILLNEGDCFGSLCAIATPGHTPGHLSFVDQRDGTLLMGDAMVSFGGRLHIVGVGHSPWLWMGNRATWHKPTALESAQKLATQNTPMLTTGHGPAIIGSEQCRAAMAQALDLAR